MAICFIFQKGQIVLTDAGGLPETGACDALSSMFLRSGLVDRGRRDGDLWAEIAAERELPPGWSLRERRGLWQNFGEETFFRIGKAYHICEWQRANRFCGACGAVSYLDEREGGIRCSACGEIVFPVIAPAVIVAVERDGKLLMGSNANFPAGRFSVLAGFVEPGERLEETVEREIYEEARIRVKDIRYFGSQPWPFPHSLMVGFTARWESGEIEVDNDELLEARWFAPDELPDIPSGVSISRRLIDDFVKRCGQPAQYSEQGEALS